MDKTFVRWAPLLTMPPLSAFFGELRNAALALVAWSVVVLWLLYVYRLPAMAKFRVSLSRIAVKNSDEYRQEQAKLPAEARQVAENYNHLMEQPTIFYALVFFALMHDDSSVRRSPALLADAWLYVALRVAHSLVQCFFNRVALRFTVFAASSLVLTHMCGTLLLRELA